MYSLYVIKVIEMIVTPLKLAVVTISISNVYHMRLGGGRSLAGLEAEAEAEGVEAEEAEEGGGEVTPFETSLSSSLK